MMMFCVFVRYSKSKKKGRVNIGMFRFQTIYSSLDVRRTKCVGQSIFTSLRDGNRPHRIVTANDVGH
jgi:hypothetical protein